MTHYNQSDLDFVLKALYDIDPGLREHEEELKKLLSRLAESRPDVKVDQAFAAELRRELLSRPAPQSWIEKTLTSMNRIPLYVGGVVTVALVALIGYNLYDSSSSVKDSTSKVALSGGITALEPGAFGNLGGMRAEGEHVPETASAGFGSGAGLGVAAVTEDASLSARPQSGGGGGMAITGIAPGEPYPEYRVYDLVYGGEEIVLSDNSLPVYMREKGDAARKALAALLIGADNGMLDLSRNTGTELTSFQLLESGPDRHFINVDLRDGRVFFNLNYATASSVPNYERVLTRDDHPADDRLISAADRFLKGYRVDMSSYGTPFVDKRWETHVLLEEDRNSAAIIPAPNVLTVIYPLMVDGQPAYDQSGHPFGISVSVDVLTLTVTGAHNIISTDFRKSDYIIETDVDRLIRIAERGGIYGFHYGDAQGGTVTLGTPETVQVLMPQWDPETGTSLELYVPALRFPLVDKPESMAYGPDYVIVPMVKDILDAHDKRLESPPGIPVPLGMPVEPDGGIGDSTEPAPLGMPVPGSEAAEMEIIPTEE